MAGAGSASGGLRVRHRPRHRGDHRATRRPLRRRDAGRRLWRLQGAGPAHQARPDPAGVLSRACAPQVRRRAQDYAIAHSAGGGRADRRDLCHRGPHPRRHGRATLRGAPDRERAADERAEAAADRAARGIVGEVDPGEGDPIHASALGRPDDVPERRTRGSRLEHCRAYHADDCPGQAQLSLRRFRTRRAQLGHPRLASHHGEAERCRPTELADRRAGAHRLGQNQEPSTARAVAMGMEGDPRRAGHESRGMIHRAADPAPAASGAARPPMSLDELDRWLRAPRQRKPAADGIAMLDGFVAAIVAGPATYEPLGWLCPLLGVTRHAINDGDTEEYAAIAAAAQHHNALAVALSEAPGRFAPIFERDAHGAIDVGPWCRGFHAAVQLNPRFWQKLLPARGLAHRWLIPILAHCTNADGRPVRGAPPHGPLTELAQFDAHRTIPADVAAIREFWAPTRYNLHP